MNTFNFFPFYGMIWVLFWVLFGLFMSRLTWYRQRWFRGNVNKSALDVLKERYAKGEINKQEFEEKKRDIV